jgi:hypothetical protein
MRALSGEGVANYSARSGQIVLIVNVPCGRSLHPRPRLAEGKTMKASTLSLGAVLVAAALAGCTTSGVGVGQSVSGNVTATFTWKAETASRGTMTASLSDGSVYTGPFFQITRETTVEDLGPLWVGWANRWRWRGWDFWGPTQEVITHYTGKVLANLQGPGGYMRCQFALASPSTGMAGGGAGQCQLPSGTVIDATFPPQ